MHSTRGQLLFVAVLALIGLTWSLEAPLLMWSGSNVFAGKQLQVQSTVGVNSFETILTKLATRQAENMPANLASIFGNLASASSEVIVLYLEPMIRSDQLSNNREVMGALRREMLGAQSSVSVPFLDHTGSESAVSKAVAALASSLPAGGRVLYTGNARTPFYAHMERSFPMMKTIALEDINESNAIFSNGVLDVLIVELTSVELNLGTKLSKDDSIVEKVQAVVKTATNGNFVSLFTSENVFSPAIATVFPESTEHIQSSSVRAIEDAEQAEEDSVDFGNMPYGDRDMAWGAYFPYWFWEGLITLLMIAGIAFGAIRMLLGMQTPTFFLSEKKKTD